VDSWHPTVGTRITGQRNTARRLVIIDGRLAPLPQPAPESTSDSRGFSPTPTASNWSICPSISADRGTVLAGLSPLTLLRNTERYCGPTHDHRASYVPLLRSRRLARG
jgi:hypothetical protein